MGPGDAGGTTLGVLRTVRVLAVAPINFLFIHVLVRWYVSRVSSRRGRRAARSMVVYVGRWSSARRSSGASCTARRLSRLSSALTPDLCPVSTRDPTRPCPRLPAAAGSGTLDGHAHGAETRTRPRSDRTPGLAPYRIRSQGSLTRLCAHSGRGLCHVPRVALAQNVVSLHFTAGTQRDLGLSLTDSSNHGPIQLYPKRRSNVPPWPARSILEHRRGAKSSPAMLFTPFSSYVPCCCRCSAAPNRTNLRAWAVS